MLKRSSAEDIEMDICGGEKNFKNSTIFALNGKFLFKNYNLINIDFSNSELQGTGFQDTDLTEANFSNSVIILGGLSANEIFFNSNLKDADFRNVQVFGYSKENRYKISLADILSQEQYNDVIKTDEEEYQSKLRLQKENQEQKNQLESTSEKQINSLVAGFEDLAKEYYFEEKFWIRIVSLVAFILIYLAFLPLLLSFYKNIYTILIPIVFFMIVYLYILEQLQPSNTTGKFQLYYKYFFEDNIKFEIFIIALIFFIAFDFRFIPNIHLENISFSMQNYYFISPVAILFVTLLYFSVTQYSKSKKLRIDNQNKIALIHGMMAIKADTTNTDKEKFYNKIADIVFDRVHHEKEENLPLDKIIQLIKAINPKDNQK